mmetsp:Transcript_65352/g.147440  ORF Transcript_65352/g.147440 Transcript_65352/m.147440 type:complete len:350 (+) Transcript_65352:115-1164(+)
MDGGSREKETIDKWRMGAPRVSSRGEARAFYSGIVDEVCSRAESLLANDRHRSSEEAKRLASVLRTRWAAQLKANDIKLEPSQEECARHPIPVVFASELGKPASHIEMGRKKRQAMRPTLRPKSVLPIADEAGPKRSGLKRPHEPLLENTRIVRHIMARQEDSPGGSAGLDEASDRLADAAAAAVSAAAAAAGDLPASSASPAGFLPDGAEALVAALRSQQGERPSAPEASQGTVHEPARPPIRDDQTEVVTQAGTEGRLGAELGDPFGDDSDGEGFDGEDYADDPEVNYLIEASQAEEPAENAIFADRVSVHREESQWKFKLRSGCGRLQGREYRVLDWELIVDTAGL